MSYTISACNVGTNIAGTGEESYGSYFVRGSNIPYPENTTPSNDWGSGDYAGKEEDRQ
ncbi:MAG: hypothetical protein LBH96_03740 [Candidatus Peribacteria bacterium]|jgi:hypothetical protein|nr:hypothetical protein [Candidatus Peribacteria bacterium]